MNHETLREQLEQLHAELNQTETVDARQRELLTTLESDIQELLGRDGDGNARTFSVDDVVAELPLGFEADRFGRVAVFRRRGEASTLADALATSSGP